MKQLVWIPKRAEIAWGLVNRTNPVLQQTNWRWRDDSEGEVATNSWLAAENTNTSVSQNTTLRLRAVIQESAGGKFTAFSASLQYRLDGGAWTQVGDATCPWGNTTSGLADETPTTDQIGGTGVFAGGYFTTGSPVISTNNIDASQHAEYEFTIQPTVAGTYEFQVIHTDGTPLDLAPSQYPAVTVQVASQNINETVTDGVQTSDSPLETEGARETSLEGIRLSETVTETVSIPVNNVEESASEGVRLSDGATDVAGLWSPWSDADAFDIAASSSYSETVEDGVTLTDVPDDAATVWSSWSAVTTVQIAQAAGYNETVTDGVVVQDAGQGAGAVAEGVSDTVTLGDGAGAGAEVGEILSEVTRAGDLLVLSGAAEESLSEGIRAWDGMQDAVALGEAVTDGATVADTASGQAPTEETLGEGIRGTDEVSVTVAFFEYVSETTQVADSSASSRAAGETLSDGTALTDQVALSGEQVEALSETVLVSDLGTSQRASQSVLGDGVLSGDSVSAESSGAYEELVADGIKSFDSTLEGVRAQESTEEGLRLADQILLEVAARIQLSDGAAITDFLVQEGQAWTEEVADTVITSDNDGGYASLLESLAEGLLAGETTADSLSAWEAAADRSELRDVVSVGQHLNLLVSDYLVLADVPQYIEPPTLPGHPANLLKVPSQGNRVHSLPGRGGVKAPGTPGIRMRG